MSKALYSKWRPVRFADVVGQQAVAQTLLNQLAADRIFHAYIFTGIRGTGKTTLARILAKAVNCLNPQNGEPCGECEICRGIDNGSILDVSEIDAASFTGVDNIRELRDETAFCPSRCKKRVYIIDEVHMLSMNAFNALLKIMEEPPEHVMFILATTEIHRVPPTILSRCIRFDLRRLTVPDITSRLNVIAQGEGIALDADAALLIARLADGAMRDAVSLLETCITQQNTVAAADVMAAAGVTDTENLFSICAALAQGDAARVLDTVGELYDNSLEPARLCTLLARHLRSALLADINPASLSAEFPESEINEYKKLSALFGRRRLIEAIKQLNSCIDAMPKSADRRLALEIVLVELCAPASAAAPVSAPPAAAAQQRSTPRPAQSSANKPAPAPSAPNPQKASPTKALSDDDGAPPPWADDADAPPEDDERVYSDIPATAEGGEAPLPETAAVPQKAPVKASPQTEKGRFAPWINVIAALRSTNPMLFAALDGSSAYLTDNMLLIDAKDSFYELVRMLPQTKTQLKDVIAQVTDCRLPIGPYKSGEAQTETVSADDPVRRVVEKARELNIQTKVTGGEK